jgi:hypothetical protein
MKFVNTTVFGIILILIVIGSVFYTNKRESFVGTVSWGRDPEVQHKEFEKTDQINSIVGPDPDSKDLYSWQYDPQSSLVNYKYYETNKDLEQYEMPLSDNRATARLAPAISSANVNIH